MEYLYRVLYRPLQHPELPWQVVNGKSYKRVTDVKIVRSQHERYNQTDGEWEAGRFITYPTCEYKFQRYPLTQEWEDLEWQI